MSSKTLSSARPEANDTSRPKWPFRGRKRPRNMQADTSVDPPRGRREHFHLLSNPFHRNPLLWYGGKTRCRASFGKALKRAGTHSGPGKTFAHPVEDVAAHQHHRLAYGLVPFRVRRESDGFIFNRIWAAIKRECLMVVEEGVAPPEDVDAMWEIFTRPGVPPFRLMDRVGLDVVLAIEEHYAAVRDGIPEGPRKLLHEYIDQGRLGVKSGRGFYEYKD